MTVSPMLVDDATFANRNNTGCNISSSTVGVAVVVGGIGVATNGRLLIVFGCFTVVLLLPIVIEVVGNTDVDGGCDERAAEEGFG
jgi:hypothetical protein